MHLQLLAARTALAALILGAAAAAIALGGLRLGQLSDAAATNLMIPAVGLGAVALLLALFWLASALGRNDGAGKRAGMAALAGALIFLYFPVLYVYYGLTALPINDATTDPEGPPQFVALAKVPSENSRLFDGRRRIPYSGPDARYRGTAVTVAYAFHDKYPLLTKPHSSLLVTPQKTFWRALEAVKALGWTVVDFSEKDLRIEATDKSLWFGRSSDIVLRVRKAGSIGSRIDIRSQSREAGKDHGRNAARLKAFFKVFHF
jgi:fatty-acyl-CoA synthase